MRRILMVLPLLLAASLLFAQSNSPSPQPKSPSNDPARMAETIRDSYYHPDALTGLECSVSLDWPSFFAQMNLNTPPEKLKQIQALKIRARSQRGKTADLSFNWAAGEPADGKEQLEGGVRQMISGFYQIYWPMIASPSIAPDTNFAKVEPQDDGTTKVSASDQTGTVQVTLDKENIPTHYALDNQAMKVGMDVHYSPSPKPAPGDLRRITGMDVAEQIGTNNVNLGVSLDYQPLSEFFVPQHVTFKIAGAWSVTMEFTDCSVPAPAQAPPQDNGPAL